MKTLVLSLIFAASMFAQVYTVNVTTPGSYASVPNVTSSGGGCSVQPTYQATLNGTTMGLATIAVTFVGTGCTSVPNLAISGAGGGFAAAVLLPASIVLLSTVPSLSGQVLQPSSSGTFLAWVFECLLSVPASRVPFYASRLYPLPGTSNSTPFQSPPSGLLSALSTGILAAYDDQVILYSGATVAVVEAAISASCTNQQTAINAWNPWAHYGSTFLNGTWIITNVP